MNQKMLVLLLGGLLTIFGMFFSPIPYYQKEEKCPLIYPVVPCQPKGWHLAPSLYQRVSGDLLKPTSFSLKSSAETSLSSTTSDSTANWQTFISEDNLYQVSIPSNWTVVYSGGSPEFGSDNKALLQINTWNYSDIVTVKNDWQSPGCGGSDPNGGCMMIPNKEVSQRRVNSYDAYIKVDNNGQMRAFIPNSTKNKTIEIDTIYLSDRKIFDQIVSSFKFLD